jgi:hypothetical protein
VPSATFSTILLSNAPRTVIFFSVENSDNDFITDFMNPDTALTAFEFHIVDSIQLSMNAAFSVCPFTKFLKQHLNVPPFIGNRLNINENTVFHTAINCDVREFSSQQLSFISNGSQS